MDFQLTEEQQYFRRMVRDFAEAELKPRARHTDRPPASREKMGPIGLLGLTVPEDYNGAGVTPSAPPWRSKRCGRCGSTASPSRNRLAAPDHSLRELEAEIPAAARQRIGRSRARSDEPGGQRPAGGVQTFAVTAATGLSRQQDGAPTPALLM
jgi:alkylation response protein AidB-like acyl-CoA dehydrogenase